MPAACSCGDSPWAVPPSGFIRCGVLHGCTRRSALHVDYELQGNSLFLHGPLVGCREHPLKARGWQNLVRNTLLQFIFVFHKKFLMFWVIPCNKILELSEQLNLKLFLFLPPETQVWELLPNQLISWLNLSLFILLQRPVFSLKKCMYFF